MRVCRCRRKYRPREGDREAPRPVGHCYRQRRSVPDNPIMLYRTCYIVTLGICDAVNSVSEVSPANLEEHFRVRVFNLLFLFLSTHR